MTGFDDVEIASQLDPQLTTVHVPAAEMGATIARYVVATLEGDEVPLPPPIAAELVVRGSTGPPRR